MAHFSQCLGHLRDQCDNEQQQEVMHPPKADEFEDPPQTAEKAGYRGITKNEKPPRKNFP